MTDFVRIQHENATTKEAYEKMKNDERFAIIGISDVDAEVKSRRALERMKEESIVYNRLSALAGEFICVYIVVPETGYYREYSATEEFNAHAISKEGLDFFATSRKEITRVIYKKDLERFMALFTEENVMSEIEQKGFFSLSYRLMLNDTPTYVQLKAVIIQEKEYIKYEHFTRISVRSIGKNAVYWRLEWLLGNENRWDYLS